jgi:hypothetical protein
LNSTDNTSEYESNPRPGGSVVKWGSTVFSYEKERLLTFIKSGIEIAVFKN